MTWSSGARFVSVVGLLVFWVGVFAAGGLVNGYSAREDYISSLASRGSPVAAVGIGALLANAAAHLGRSSATPRWLGQVSLAFAAGSVALIFQTNGDHIGLCQRLWLANNLAWLLLVAWTATARPRVIDKAG